MDGVSVTNELLDYDYRCIRGRLGSHFVLLLPRELGLGLLLLHFQTLLGGSTRREILWRDLDVWKGTVSGEKAGEL